MARTILVTGATGTVGSDVLRLLRGRDGLQIRAAVRDKTKSAALAGPGVDLALFDYDKPETFAPACQGIDSIFMVAAFNPNGVAQSRAFLDAASQSGVTHVTKLSVIHSVRAITVGKWHAAIDDALKKSGMAWTLLCPGGFMQNFVETTAPQPDGGMYLPAGSAKACFIDTRDIAAVAVKTLTEPGHEGKEYTLTGPEDLSYAEVAVIMSEVSGRMIRYVDVPEDVARQAMLAGHLPEWLVDVLLELNAWSRNGGAAEISSTVQDILGRPPHTFREFAHDYADQWKV